MKRLFVLMMLSLATVFTVCAQDIIIKINGEEILSKVEEVGELSIKYRKFTNMNGPLYSISRKDVSEIHYESGDKDIITRPDETAQAPVTVTEPEKREPTVLLMQKSDAARKPERGSLNEFGVRVEPGISTWSMKSSLEELVASNNYDGYLVVSNHPQAAFALSVFAEHYFRSGGTFYVGGALGFSHDATKCSWGMASTEMSMKLKYNTLFVDLIIGDHPVKKGFYFDGKIRLGYIVGMKGRMDGSDDVLSAWDIEGAAPGEWMEVGKDKRRAVQYMPIFELGYCFGNLDLGLQWGLGISPYRQSMGNRPGAFSLSCAYRF